MYNIFLQLPRWKIICICTKLVVLDAQLEKMTSGSASLAKKIAGPIDGFV